MKQESRRCFCIALCMLSLFLLWTAAIRLIDVQAIGPQGSAVGFATVNRFVHDLTGVHMSLYAVTDWLSLVPFLFAAGFGMLGLVQWIRRKHLLRVDRDLLVLGGFYIAVMAVYLLFELVVVNYRPVLINGIPEPSYPSSTTMLVMCVMPTALMQFHRRIKHGLVRRWVSTAGIAFTLFMVIGRLVSGVHWFTDIVGGAFLSTGLVLLYAAFILDNHPETR